MIFYSPVYSNYLHSALWRSSRWIFEIDPPKKPIKKRMVCHHPLSLEKIEKALESVSNSDVETK